MKTNAGQLRPQTTMVDLEQAESEQTDESLYRYIHTGDESAFTLLYRRRQAPIYRFALHMTGSTSIAEDITQEVFLSLLTRRSTFDPSRGPLAAFLFGIARNKILKRLRHSKEAPSQDSFINDDLLTNLVRHETIEEVRRAVLTLPPTYREAVVLCDLEESSYEDAAIALECPIGTVRSRLSRGRAMLAQKLAPIRRQP